MYLEESIQLYEKSVNFLPLTHSIQWLPVVSYSAQSALKVSEFIHKLLFRV